MKIPSQTLEPIIKNKPKTQKLLMMSRLETEGIANLNRDEIGNNGNTCPNFIANNYEQLLDIKLKNNMKIKPKM